MTKRIVAIAEELRRKQLLMGAILEKTKEIETYFANNDQETADLVLGERMELINSSIQCDENIGRQVDQADLSQSLKLAKILKLEIEGMDISEDEKILIDLSREIRSIAGRALEIDKSFSKRMFGSASIYHEESK